MNTIRKFQELLIKLFQFEAWDLDFGIYRIINYKCDRIKKVIQSLVQNAFTSTGDLKNEFKDTPLGMGFLTLKAQKERVEAIDEIRLKAYNDIIMGSS